MNSKLEYIKNNLDVIKDMISKNLPKFEIARTLGVKYETLNKHLKSLGIDYAGNQSGKGIKGVKEKVPVEEYLGTGKFITASNLRKKLIECGLKDDRCECCGLDSWMGKKIPLELHHINLDHFDNRLENLQILCSNCHAIAHDYCNTKGKKEYASDRKRRSLGSKKVKYCEYCGKELVGRKNKYCSQKCAHASNSNIPEKEELEKKLVEYNWNKSKTGRYFGVSDNTVKKWIVKYNLSK